MNREWQDVRREAASQGLLDEERVATHRAHLDAEVRAYRLAEVRKEQHLTQKQLAAAMRVGQPRVSQIENGDLANTELSTLTAYVEALGGEVQIVASFGERKVRLS